MVYSISLIILGVGVGSFGTLIGAGGGFLITPILLILYPQMPPEIITSISLAIVFCNAFSGSITYAQMKRIDFRSGIIFSAASIPASISGAYFVSFIPRHLFNIFFSLFLLAVAIFTILFRNKTSNTNYTNKPLITTRTILTKNGQRYRYSYNLLTGIIISFCIGLLSSMMGVGGGIIHVPAMIGLLNFPLPVATATSHFIVAIITLTSTIIHFVSGDFNNVATTPIFIGIGVIIGARLGAHFSHKIDPKWIIRSLGATLFFVSIRLLLLH